MNRVRLTDIPAREPAQNVAREPRLEGHRTKEIKRMLLYEDMSRIRMHEDQHTAATHRAANRMLAIRRWERIAGWAAKRAARLRED